MTIIIDYGAGNLFSVQNALDYIGCPAMISGDAEDIAGADRLILPGVGAFPDAMKMLNEAGLTDVIKSEVKKKPLLGICLGMQMLFERSSEFGDTEGLGLIPGRVELMTPPGLLIPQIGWNRLLMNEDCPILAGLGEEPYVYFVHSYAAVCPSGNVAAYTDYGGNVPACVFAGNVYGCQFHPEKSGEVGLKILENFVKL
ncbi:MAG: imidazole glycerol phosphate synthase subunit HisH [Bacteroides sp.]|nr:imidazole glycerol phosphate synthase subunit HisH [Eubacterium sp.]MCM1418357.1 imidazole glycerol phosphate synthase subunit HisH [Roseburia sp.]MCM1462839.1 imidazole glycerol phosphate synthase subunit HisH [Bacteroides sp.]